MSSVQYLGEHQSFLVNGAVVSLEAERMKVIELGLTLCCILQHRIDTRGEQLTDELLEARLKLDELVGKLTGLSALDTRMFTSWLIEEYQKQFNDVLEKQKEQAANAAAAEQGEATASPA